MLTAGQIKPLMCPRKPHGQGLPKVKKSISPTFFFVYRQSGGKYPANCVKPSSAQVTTIGFQHPGFFLAPFPISPEYVSPNIPRCAAITSEVRSKAFQKERNANKA